MMANLSLNLIFDIVDFLTILLLDILADYLAFFQGERIAFEIQKKLQQRIVSYLLISNNIFRRPYQS